MDQILVEAPGYLSLRLMYTCTRVTLNKDDMKASIIISVVGCMCLTYLCIVSCRVIYSVQRVLRVAKIEDSHVAVLSNVAPRHRYPPSPVLIPHRTIHKAPLPHILLSILEVIASYNSRVH